MLTIDTASVEALAADVAGKSQRPPAIECVARRTRRLRGSGATADLAQPAQIIAFSDPNDLMSHPVPDKFAERYIKSRLCPSVTNVPINVAAVNSILGLGDVANPLAAPIPAIGPTSGWAP